MHHSYDKERERWVYFWACTPTLDSFLTPSVEPEERQCVTLPCSFPPPQRI